MTTVTGWIDDSAFPRSKCKQFFHLQLAELFSVSARLCGQTKGELLEYSRMQAAVGDQQPCLRAEFESNVEPGVAARDVAQCSWP